MEMLALIISLFTLFLVAFLYVEISSARKAIREDLKAIRNELGNKKG